LHIRIKIQSVIGFQYWYATYYVIGGELYSLQSILNGILRGNRKGVAMLWQPFGPEDRRLNLAIPLLEPLIHFAITSGAKSTNPLRLYTTTVAIEFLESKENFSVDLKHRIICISKIFKWYAEDFGGSTTEV
uniref:DUF547 domain-containing protein n=1 Tax=Ascaris lumbricoides TaxID=6252 RepID=A0A0M3IHE1_ASCLU